jgi:uncharacterized protein YdeI (YjbR/CyaY-like superfamily)
MSAEPVFFEDRTAWRSWLEKNHDKEKEVWLLVFKKHTGKKSISYNEAVEEALCFGWIDSVMNRIDEEKFKQKFTPRNKKSPWSLLNKNRALKMIKEGKMAPAGKRKIAEAKKNGLWKTAYTLRKKVVLSLDLKKALQKNRLAWKNFQAFADGYKNHYIFWLDDAKTTETRARRIKKIVSRAAKNKKPGVP